ncbi:MAG: hypothetical protein R3C11_04395 [Planctomycetaceae bacterium]
MGEYKQKRDFMLKELGDDYDIRGADGAFYLFSESTLGNRDRIR